VDHRGTARVSCLPVAHQREPEQVSGRVERLGRRRLEAEHGRNFGLVFEPCGAVGPGDLLFGTDHAPLDVEGPGRQQARREQGGQDARPFDAPVEDVITVQRRSRGIHDGASAARDETLERGGEGRMPDRVGQIDHLTLEDRPQSPLPPAVVGDEPHVKGRRSVRPGTDRITQPNVGSSADEGSCRPWAGLRGTG